MDRRNRRSIESELRDLERELEALTARIATLRTSGANDYITAFRDAALRTPQIGDRVRFSIPGIGFVEGTVISITPQRLRIRQTRTGEIFLRAPHNVSIID